MTAHSLGLRSLILVGVLGFALFLAIDRGLLGMALASDRSYLSYIILAVYLAMSVHWAYLVFVVALVLYALTMLVSLEI